MAINLADVVQLRSGGPLMTVFAVGNSTVRTEWFDAAGLLHSGIFSTGNLVLSSFVAPGGPPSAATKSKKPSWMK